MSTVFTSDTARPFAKRLFPAALVLMLVLGRPALQPAARAGAYPAPGRPDPGAPCAQGQRPPWLAFVCRFMTVDLWQAAGRPVFTAADGTHWRPWYYGDVSQSDNNLLYQGSGLRRRNEGLLEALQKTDTLPDQYDPAYVSRYWSLFRYTPWSVHFERALGCGPGRAVNPNALTGRGRDRSQLLSFGWAPLGSDAEDPTGSLAAGALPGMLTLIEGRRPARAVINALAGGRGPHPDYDRDGEVWLVKGKGGQRIKDLDAAAAAAARTGRLFVNGPARTWRQGFQAAAAQVRAAGRPMVYIYFAGDGFHPAAADHVLTARLRYVLRGATRRAGARRTPISVFSPARRAAMIPLVGAMRGVALRRVGGPSVQHGAGQRGCIDVTHPG